MKNKLPDGNKLSIVRRKNREVVDESWVIEKLNSEKFGVFATANAEQPYINSNLFLYVPEENAIYFHTAGRGRTKSNIENNPKMCFSIANIGEVVYEREAVNFSMQYESIVIFGHCEIVTDHEKIMKSFHTFFKKYVPDVDQLDIIPFTLEDALKATVYKLTIEEWSAKRNTDQSYSHKH